MAERVAQHRQARSVGLGTSLCGQTSMNLIFEKATDGAIMLLSLVVLQLAEKGGRHAQSCRS